MKNVHFLSEFQTVRIQKQKHGTGNAINLISVFEVGLFQRDMLVTDPQNPQFGGNIPAGLVPQMRDNRQTWKRRRVSNCSRCVLLFIYKLAS